MWGVALLQSTVLRQGVMIGNACLMLACRVSFQVVVIGKPFGTALDLPFPVCFGQ